MRLIIFSILLFAFSCFGQEAFVVDVSKVQDPVDLIIRIISDWGTMSLLGRSVAIVLLGTSLASKFLPEGGWKRLIVTLLGAVNGVLIMISEGAPWWKALIVGGISSGAAVAIYEAIKGVKKVAKK